MSIPNIPIKFREKVRSLHKKIGSKKFFSKLIKLDPLVKNRIKSSDTQRSIRAYEVKSFTKKSIYLWFKKTKSNYQQKDFYKIYIDFPKDKLIERIHFRAQELLKKGAISEVKKFNSLKVRNDKTACKAIGIREVNEYIQKKIKIAEVIEKISIKTRQYAKRQRTWANGNMQNWIKINPIQLTDFLKKI